VTRRLLPTLSAEFGARFCVHAHERGVVHPIVILASRSSRVTAYGGYPTLDELRELLRAALEDRAPVLTRPPPAGP
jgi:hypothetical protein